MAQRTVVQLFDDLDGSSSNDIETVAFGLDGVAYEIALNTQHAADLRDALAEFVASARKVGGRSSRRGRATVATSGSGSGRSRQETHAIREWAKQQGKKISERGRIPADVVREFEESHS